MDNKKIEFINNITEFINLTEKLFAEKTQHIIFNLLRKEHQVIVDVGITGAPGEPGHAEPISRETLLSSLKPLNIDKIEFLADGSVILDHSSRNDSNE